MHVLCKLSQSQYKYEVAMVFYCVYLVSVNAPVYSCSWQDQGFFFTFSYREFRQFLSELRIRYLLKHYLYLENNLQQKRSPRCRIGEI